MSTMSTILIALVSVAERQALSESETYREFKTHSPIVEPGRNRLTIICPWCNREDVAYIRSMGARGKKCSGCGAIHKKNGFSMQPEAANG